MGYGAHLSDLAY